MSPAEVTNFQFKRFDPDHAEVVLSPPSGVASLDLDGYGVMIDMKLPSDQKAKAD